MCARPQPSPTLGETPGSSQCISIITPRLRCCPLPGKRGWMPPSSFREIRRVLTASASALKLRSMQREKSWLLFWVAVRLRSSGPLVQRSRTTPCCITSRNRSAVTTEIWISATEHPCVLAGARHYFPRSHRLIPAGRSGIVDLDWLESNLRARRPGAIAVMAANNETGVLQPWREILSLSESKRFQFSAMARNGLEKNPPRSRRVRLCQRVRAQIWRAAGRRVSQDSTTWTILPAPARRRAGRRPTRRHGKCSLAFFRWSPPLEHREQSLAEHALSEKIRLRDRLRDKT